MSKAVGVILILAGMGVASSLLAIGSDAEQDPGRTGIAEGRPADNPSIAATVQAKQPPNSASAPAAATSQPAPQRAGSPPAAQPPATSSAPVVVTLPHRVEPAPAEMRKIARMPPDRTSLARDLQLELRRVGCYGGEINGVWTPATRRAMKSFTHQVNAALPMEEPDYILLTLVQAHRAVVCGKPCPAGQGLSDDGRCLPSAILARAANKASPPAAPTARRKGGQPTEKPAPAIAGWSTTTAAVPAPTPGPRPIGRMALAGPKTEAPPAVVEPPRGLPTPAVRIRRERPARVHERPARFVERTHVQRSGFVESVLFSRHSLN